ncbi:odorant receptor Or1-like [Harmonia axyridis]|uniref:odorant receptor Or1-like n=1 Tax=Harmonia axyridis TaxID=115357 RepID=UPI001E277479|nr:odorant receptor Or1-like [Harmonia axyridis]
MKDFRIFSILGITITLLRISGLWRDDRKYFSKKIYTLYSLWVLIFFLVLDYAAVALAIFYCQGDLEKLSKQICYCTQRSITMVQTIFFLRKRDVLKTIMQQLDSEIIQPKTAEYKMIIVNSLKSHFFITRSYFWFCICTLIGFLALPVLFAEKRFPFDVWPPLQFLGSPWFEIVYVHQCIATFLNHFIHSSVDILCSGLMAIIGSQCDFLKAKLENFQPLQRDGATGENMEGDDYDSYFRDIFAHHKEILLLSKRVNIFFSQLVFGEISLVIMLLCTSLFRLSIVVANHQTSELLLMASFIFAMTTQLFLYCWFGSEAHSKSIQLHSGSFHCNWVGSAIPFQKNLIFFMQKTATPIKIYALHFFELSTVTFTSIMRSSWSFYVLLQQLNAEEGHSP